MQEMAKFQEFTFLNGAKFPIYPVNSSLAFRDSKTLPLEQRVLIDSIWNSRNSIPQVSFALKTLIHFFEERTKNIVELVNRCHEKDKEIEHLNKYVEKLQNENLKLAVELEHLKPSLPLEVGSEELIARLTFRTNSTLRSLPIGIRELIGSKYKIGRIDLYRNYQEELGNIWSTNPFEGFKVRKEFKLMPLVLRAVVDARKYNPVVCSRDPDIDLSIEAILAMGLLAEVKFTHPSQVTFSSRKLNLAIYIALSKGACTVQIKSTPPRHDNDFRCFPAQHYIYIFYSSIMTRHIELTEEDIKNLPYHSNSIMEWHEQMEAFGIHNMNSWTISEAAVPLFLENEYMKIFREYIENPRDPGLFSGVHFKPRLYPEEQTEEVYAKAKVACEHISSIPEIAEDIVSDY